MFHTAKDFERAMYQLLINIRGGAQPRSNFNMLDQDFDDVCKTAVELGYLEGVSSARGLAGVKFMPDCRLSYRGLKFIEQMESSAPQ